jgi:hypothetical protein
MNEAMDRRIMSFDGNAAKTAAHIYPAGKRGGKQLFGIALTH